jgi:hypothetical protein
MNAADLVETVTETNNTALSRLGSSKSIYADTSGEMQPETVLAAAASTRRHAADLFDDWAAAADGEFVAVYGDVADAVGGQADDLADRVDAFDPGQAPALVDYLDGLEGDVERAGGLLGWALVADEKTTQLTGFFTGQADPQTASTFRGYGSDYDDAVDAVSDLLDAHCPDEADWTRAREAAAGAVQAAYDDYVETLESMGVNPKPVC